MDIPQLLKDYGELISITLIPFIIWFMGIMFQDRQSKRKAKEVLFLTLIANRKAYPINKEYADALNQIDVIFQDNKKVRNAWRAYFDSLHPSSQHFGTSNSFLLDLLSEIANDLNYKDLKQTELDRFYSPQGFANDTQTVATFYQEYIRVLANSKSLAKGYTSKELKQKAKGLETET